MSTTDDAVRVSVLSLRNSKETRTILSAVESLGHEPVWFRRENAAASIGDSGVTVEPEVDIIADQLLLSNTEELAGLLELATTFNRIRPMFDEPDTILTAIHKFATATTLANWSIQVPDALLALSNGRLSKDRERFGDVGICKSIIGTHGGGTWKVDLAEPINPKVDNRQAFLQRLIDHDGDRHRDLRVYIVNGDIVGAVYRYTPEGDWRANVALDGDVPGATDEMLDEAKQTVLYAVEVMEVDCVGVDLVGDGNGWFVLGVNPAAGSKDLYQVTGKSPTLHIARLTIERASGKADETRVEELSATLGDSVSSCAPNKSPIIDGEAPLVGYIEEVVVNGASDSQQTLAKSDASATRTSIGTSPAAEVGAGPIKNMTRVKSGSLKSGKTRPVVDLVIGTGGTQHTVTANVEDRSHMDYPLLLGRDILGRYRVDVRRYASADRSDSDDEEEGPLRE